MGLETWGFSDGESINVRTDPKKYFTEVRVEWFQERRGIFRRIVYVVEPRMYNGYGNYVSPHAVEKVWDNLEALMADNIPEPKWWQRPFWHKTPKRYELRLREHAIITKLNYQG